MLRTRTTMVLAMLAIGATGVAHAEPEPAEIARARVVYQALLTGQIQIGELSPQQLAELVELDRQLRSDQRSASQRCVDAELESVGNHPSRLARRVIEMKCRELGER